MKRQLGINGEDYADTERTGRLFPARPCRTAGEAQAELDITDDGKSYGMHSGIAVVTMMSEWDESGNQTAEYTEFRI